MRRVLLAFGSFAALSLLGMSVASAQTLVVGETYAAPVYDYDYVPARVYAPAPAYAAPVFVAPSPIYTAPAVPTYSAEVVAAPAPARLAAPGVVYAEW